MGDTCTADLWGGMRSFKYSQTKQTILFENKYCIQTLTRNSWIRYTDCWIV